ncbi:GGDEF domain-containing protein [Photobacterium makurazakiensis]|uniref:GGDEF domain-containing protein n=1 Tax=Photobacterium makurazakiensis TaxID=2910234 RepID=UPI003D1208B4
MQLVPFSIFRHAFVRFALPSLLAFAALLCLQPLQHALVSYEELLQLLPYTLLPIAVILGQLFNQGRTSMAALLMLIAYYIIQSELQSPLAVNQTMLTYTLLAFLLPLNILNLHLTQNRRIFSRSNITYIGFIVSQLAWGGLVVQHFKDVNLSALWDSYLFNTQPFSPLPIVIISISVLACAVQASAVLKRNHSDDQALFICTLFTGITFIFFQYPLISSTAFSIASILLLLNLITCSHELAYIDQLTSIAGRRALETELKHLGRTYTIAMLDIDHFKQFNDTYGHQTGDNVLQLVASILSNQHSGAKVFRYGGEEFTILFKGKEVSECLDALESLRQEIASYPLTLRLHSERPKDDVAGIENRQTSIDKKQVRITVSIGVADSYLDPKPQLVLKAADKALYNAKASGRNQVSTRHKKTRL